MLKIYTVILLVNLYQTMKLNLKETFAELKY